MSSLSACFICGTRLQGQKALLLVGAWVPFGRLSTTARGGGGGGGGGLVDWKPERSLSSLSSRRFQQYAYVFFMVLHMLCSAYYIYSELQPAFSLRMHQQSRDLLSQLEARQLEARQKRGKAYTGVFEEISEPP